MSLLEDVFLEDEANEAQELERIIEGDEFDEQSRARSDSDDNSEQEGEAVEEKKRVDPASTKTRRVIKNPRFILNPARLTGPRGMHVIPEHFKDFKFKGKGHEKEDLDLVLKKLEHWAYRLYPKFKFEDCLKKIETLGKKRPVMVNLQKIRTDQFMSEETIVQRDSSDDEVPRDGAQEAPPEDEFDKLLQQQIELARSTPTPGSVKKGMDSAVKENRSLMLPKATSSPSISDEQREKIRRSRKLAEERRLSRLKNASNTINDSQNSYSSTPLKSDGITYPVEKLSDSDKVNTDKNNENTCDNISNVNECSSNDNNKVNSEIESNIEENDGGVVRKSRANVIDSSSEDDDIGLVNESITADVHKDIGLGCRNGMNQGPKINGHDIDNDDVILKMDDISNNDQERSNLDIEGGTVTNDEVHTNINVKSDDTPKVNNHENKLSENHANEIVNIGTSKGHNNLKDNNTNINKEDDIEMVITEKHTSDVTAVNNKDTGNSVESVNVTSVQEQNLNELKHNQESNSDVMFPKLSKEAVETNVDELMDVEFDDDF